MLSWAEFRAVAETPVFMRSVRGRAHTRRRRKRKGLGGWALTRRRVGIWRWEGSHRLEMSLKRPRQEMPETADVSEGFETFGVRGLPTSLKVPTNPPRAEVDFFPVHKAGPLEPPYLDYGGLSALLSVVVITPRGTHIRSRQRTGAPFVSSDTHAHVPDALICRCVVEADGRGAAHGLVLGHGPRAGGAGAIQRPGTHARWMQPAKS